MSSKPAPFRLFDDGTFLGLEKTKLFLPLGALSVVQQAGLAVVLSWVVPLILAALQGRAVGPTRAESFLLAPSMYARFLIALPLLLLSQRKDLGKARAHSGSLFERAARQK